MVPNQGEDGAHAGLQLLQVLTGRGGNSATAKEPSTTYEHVTTHYRRSRSSRSGDAMKMPQGTHPGHAALLVAVVPTNKNKSAD